MALKDNRKQVRQVDLSANEVMVSGLTVNNRMDFLKYSSCANELEMSTNEFIYIFFISLLIVSCVRL